MSEEKQITAPQFVGGRSRAKTIPLEWHVEYDGKVYESVTLVRLTAGEVAAFIESTRDQPEDAPARFPLYRDAEGGKIPDAVMDALDDDDAVAINAAVLDFLPRRFRAALESGSGPETGAPIEPS